MPAEMLKSVYCNIIQILQIPKILQILNDNYVSNPVTPKLIISFAFSFKKAISYEYFKLKCLLL